MWEEDCPVESSSAQPFYMHVVLSSAQMPTR